MRHPLALYIILPGSLPPHKRRRLATSKLSHYGSASASCLPTSRIGEARAVPGTAGEAASGSVHERQRLAAAAAAAAAGRLPEQQQQQGGSQPRGSGTSRPVLAGARSGG